MFSERAQGHRQAAGASYYGSMELGGNAPFIVCKDADIEAAADGLMVAKMRNLGEACTAANRIYVQDGVFDAFSEKLTAAVADLKVGEGTEDGVTQGRSSTCARLRKWKAMWKTRLPKAQKC